MKRFFTSIILALVAIVSCSKFDDSKIWKELNEHESRISLLEELCKKLNSDIVNLQTIVTALEANDYVVNTSPLATGDGYTIVFKSGKSIVIYNGKDGKDGEDGKDGKDGEDGKDGKDGIDGKDGEDGIDGVAPSISVMKDIDGIYYWTVNNEWLLVNGEKVKAVASDGEDGVTPKFKIEEDYWFISYNNGAIWEKLGKATGDNGLDGINGEDGDSIFQKVTQDDEYVYFYLTDGTMITLSKHNTDIIQFEDLNLKAICCKKWDTNLDGELSYDEASAVEKIDSDFNTNDNIIAFTELKYFSNLKSIGSYAFYGCTSLWKIEFPESLEEIGYNAFDGCNSLCYINIPKNVKKIESRAFYQCQNIKSVVIESKVWTECGAEAFYQCGGKAYINGDIPSNAFMGSFLTELIVSDQVVMIGNNAFYGSYKLVTIKIGKNVQKIGDSAFGNCGITDIVIPDSVTEIGSNAFIYCDNLTSVIIGEGITTIGSQAFMTNNYSNNKLKNVRILSTTPPTIGTHALYVHNYNNSYNTHSYSVPTNMTISVPNTSLSSYKSQWSNFKNNIIGF